MLDFNEYNLSSTGPDELHPLSSLMFERLLHHDYKEINDNLLKIDFSKCSKLSLILFARHLYGASKELSNYHLMMLKIIEEFRNRKDDRQVLLMETLLENSKTYNPWKFGFSIMDYIRKVRGIN